MFEGGVPLRVFKLLNSIIMIFTKTPQKPGQVKLLGTTYEGEKLEKVKIIFGCGSSLTLKDGMIVKLKVISTRAKETLRTHGLPHDQDEVLLTGVGVGTHTLYVKDIQRTRFSPSSFQLVEVIKK
jgi:hypothetical protein